MVILFAVCNKLIIGGDMKKIFILAMLIFSVCNLKAEAGYIKPNALFYDNSTIPLTVYADSNVTPSKRGSATCISYLWLYTKGKCGLQDAMQNGNITKFWGADKTTKSYAGVYMKIRTDVYGE